MKICQNTCESAVVILDGKFIASNAYARKKSQISKYWDLNIHLKKLGKEQ